MAVAGHDKDSSKLALLEKEGAGKPVKGFGALNDFVESLDTPKVIILLVPAGKIVDAVIDELRLLLWVNKLEPQGLHFFGMGISGGEEGARNGPSIMPGGDRAAYLFVKPILETIAAKVNGEPCVTYIGPGASGHFVKMVHNGIEYALMQLIADTHEI